MSVYTNYMQRMATSNTPEKVSRRAGKRFLIRFESEAELRKVKRAAAKAQAGIRKQMGKRFPNASLFIAEAALEKAGQILHEGRE
jgi:hypothetical protein